MSTDLPVASPCISVCQLDELDVCTGCYRSAEEITCWTRYSNDEKRQVIKRAGQRFQSRHTVRLL